jgi:hypothetical protein
MKGSFLRGLSASLTLHSFRVTLFSLDSLLWIILFLIQLQINTLYYRKLSCPETGVGKSSWTATSRIRRVRSYGDGPPYHPECFGSNSDPNLN